MKIICVCGICLSDCVVADDNRVYPTARIFRYAEDEQRFFLLEEVDNNKWWVIKSLERQV